MTSKGNHMSTIHRFIGQMLAPRDERGLSQSTEQAILLGGAVLVALAIVAAVTLFVNNQLKVF